MLWAIGQHRLESLPRPVAVASQTRGQAPIKLPVHRLRVQRAPGGQHLVSLLSVLSHEVSSDKRLGHVSGINSRHHQSFQLRLSVSIKLAGLHTHQSTLEARLSGLGIGDGSTFHEGHPDISITAPPRTALGKPIGVRIPRGETLRPIRPTNRACQSALRLGSAGQPPDTLTGQELTDKSDQRERQHHAEPRPAAFVTGRFSTRLVTFVDSVDRHRDP